MATVASSESWCWVDEVGNEHPLAENELIGLLSAEIIPNFTLVWRQGWAEWLPAMQVAELSWALPAGKADQSRKAKLAAAPGAARPQPELTLYAELKERAREVERLASAPHEQRPAPRVRARVKPQDPERADAQGDSLGDELIDDKFLIERQSVSPVYLDDTEALFDTNFDGAADKARAPRSGEADVTVAVLDPPSPSWLAAQANALGREDVARNRAETDALSGPATAAPASEGPATGVADLPPTTREPLPPTARAATPPGDVTSHGFAAALAHAPTERSREDEMRTQAEFAPRVRVPEPTLNTAVPRPPRARAQTSSASVAPARTAHAPQTSGAAHSPTPDFSRSRRNLQLLAAALLLAVSGLVVLRSRPAFFARFSDSATPTQAPASVATQAVRPGAATGPNGSEALENAQLSAERLAAELAASGPPLCSVVRGPRQIAEWVRPKVRPILASTPQDQVALGYAQTDFYAIGLIIDLKTLDRSYPFRAFRRQEIISVAPTAAIGKLDFAVERGPSDLAFSRVVDALPPFTIGQSTAAISVRAKGQTKDIWKLPMGRFISTPLVNQLSDGRFLTVFRLGGDPGSIHAGMVTDGGQRGSELVRIESSAIDIGEPSVALNGDSIAIAHAGREINSAYSRIYVGQAQKNSIPSSTTELRLPLPDVAGAGVDAPHISPLAKGHYLLAWSELAAGKRRARVLVLDQNLMQLGEPLLASTSDQQATPVGLWAAGNQALLLFYVEGENTELWASSLRCSGRD